MVAAGVLEMDEALVELVVLAAPEEDALCFSSDLLVSLVLCCSSDCVFS